MLFLLQYYWKVALQKIIRVFPLQELDWLAIRSSMLSSHDNEVKLWRCMHFMFIVIVACTCICMDQHSSIPYCLMLDRIYSILYTVLNITVFLQTWHIHQTPWIHLAWNVSSLETFPPKKVPSSTIYPQCR